MREKITYAQRHAAIEASGNKDVTANHVRTAMAYHANFANPEKELAEAYQQFEASGGRGVELADKIDLLQIGEAIRKLPKCARTVCQHQGIHRHSQNQKLYCHSCAIKINELNRVDMNGKDLIPIELE